MQDEGQGICDRNGSEAVQKRIGETVFAFKALPIGGSVMLDEDVENDDPRSFRTGLCG